MFTVAGTTYALRSHEVQHMEMVEKVTRVPNAASFVDGVVFSRGQVVPAVNLRARFGFERAPYDLRTRLIVVRPGAAASGSSSTRPGVPSLVGRRDLPAAGDAGGPERPLRRRHRVGERPADSRARPRESLNFAEPLIAAVTGR